MALFHLQYILMFKKFTYMWKFPQHKMKLVKNKIRERFFKNSKSAVCVPETSKDYWVPRINNFHKKLYALYNYMQRSYEKIRLSSILILRIIFTVFIKNLKRKNKTFYHYCVFHKATEVFLTSCQFLVLRSFPFLWLGSSFLYSSKRESKILWYRRNIVDIRASPWIQFYRNNLQGIE